MFGRCSCCRVRDVNETGLAPLKFGSEFLAAPPFFHPSSPVTPGSNQQQVKRLLGVLVSEITSKERGKRRGAEARAREHEEQRERRRRPSPAQQIISGKQYSNDFLRCHDSHSPVTSWKHFSSDALSSSPVSSQLPTPVRSCEVRHFRYSFL